MHVVASLLDFLRYEGKQSLHVRNKNMATGAQRNPVVRIVFNIGGEIYE
jgi:hypothetical protein